MRLSWLAVATVACLPLTNVVAQEDIQLVKVASGLRKPTAVVSSKDGSNRMFVVEQCNSIRIMKYGHLFPTPFLDLSNVVRCSGNEEGVLGLAFHPNYKENGFFYVNMSIGTSAANRRNVIRRYSVSANNNNAADPGSFKDILAINQPFSNHNGGDLAFGPDDGYLYIASGDGGSGGDPRNYAQNMDSLLGKILRLDVDNEVGNYIPADNPFVSESNIRSEIWAYGVRNPWRMSFDRETGDFFFGDVGQNEFEEVNHVPANTAGVNYGWRMMEGRACYNPSSNCEMPDLTLPILTYPTSRDCSVVGGYRYRGRELPESMKGKYIYGDYCSGRMWVATEDPSSKSWSSETLLETNLLISSFGESERGELYVVGHRDGGIYRIQSLSTNCQDREDFNFFDNPTKTCAWLLRRGKRKRRKLCRQTLADGTKARNLCPRACKARCQ